MAPSRKYAALRGSERTPLAGAREVGPADPQEQIAITLFLRRRPAGEKRYGPDKFAKGLPRERRYHTREEYAALHGADPADVAAVESFAHTHGLTIVASSIPRRTVELAGTVAALSQAFNVKLTMYEHPGGSYRGRTGAVQVPSELSQIVEAVLGLDNRPQAKAHFRCLKKEEGIAAPRAGSTSFTPVQVAELYDFPAAQNGQGQCVAIIELGGGYRTTDLDAYFQSLGLATPSIMAYSVSGATNSPTGNPDGPDGEVMLDIEVVGAVAPGASMVVYFAPNTDNGFLNAITTAIHDTVHKPSVISISWGGPESSWTTQAMSAYDQAFQEIGRAHV